MMDDRPFFTFDLDNYKKGDLRTLAAFQRADFDLERIVSHAGALKLQSEVTAVLRTEFANPSDDLVRIIASRLHDGRLTEAVREKFRNAIGSSIASLIRDGINERLESAISQGDIADEIPTAPEGEEGIDTTQIEIDGFNIIRAICSSKVSPNRIVIRDAKSYCAVLLDDNNRRTIARMHFNSPKVRYLGVFSGKEETRYQVDDVVDIFQHQKALLARIAELEAGSSQ